MSWSLRSYIYCDDLHFLTQELFTELHDQIRYDVYLINRLISALKRKQQAYFHDDREIYGQLEETNECGKN